MLSKCPPCAHMILDGHASIDDVPVKHKTGLDQAFLQVIDVINLCFTHDLLYNTPYKLRHMMTLVHFDEVMIHLMQYSLIISRCNITFSVF